MVVKLTILAIQNKVYHHPQNTPPTQRKYPFPDSSQMITHSLFPIFLFICLFGSALPSLNSPWPPSNSCMLPPPTYITSFNQGSIYFTIIASIVLPLVSPGILLDFCSSQFHWFLLEIQHGHFSNCLIWDHVSPWYCVTTTWLTLGVCSACTYILWYIFTGFINFYSINLV